ncbi:MAG: SH3 domain-containing protein [Stomatobaculum sp.]|nr:SH3 domain-containing protein [Stomatobaculum sp.]
MRCKNCGAPLKDGAKFCTKCGAPVGKKSFLRTLPVILLALVITFGGGIAAIRTLGSIKAGVSGYDVTSGKDKGENKKQKTKKEETAEKTAAEKTEKTAETLAVETQAAETQAMLTQAAGTKAAEWPTGEPLTLPAVMPDNSYSAVPETGHSVMNGTAAQASGVLMQVVNCDEWISLRTAPSTGAERITTIPLGASVTWLDSAPGGFCLVEYQGSIGFALGQYLQAVR